ncbi:hypothetical protein M3J09_009335 [Ascochyta lentis]
MLGWPNPTSSSFSRSALQVSLVRRRLDVVKERNASYQPQTHRSEALADPNRKGGATSDETLNFDILVERHCETQVAYLCVRAPNANTSRKVVNISLRTQLT